MERPQRGVRLVSQGKHPVDIERKRDGPRKKACTEGGCHQYKDNDSWSKRRVVPIDWNSQDRLGLEPSVTRTEMNIRRAADDF
jgi:hypothetical protein